MKKLNLFFGLILLVSFLFSGYYMSEYFTPQNMDNIVQRTQIRSNHIYMLLISLLNIVSSRIEFSQGSKASAWMHVTFSLLLVSAGLLALPAFWYEHTGDIDNRILTFFSIVIAFSAVAIFLLNELIALRSQKMKK